MTTKEHMDNLAQRYAKALVNYHISPDQGNYRIMLDLHDMLNEVTKELAEEILETM